MKKIGKEFEELQYDVEYIHCSSDPDSLDGVIIPKAGVGIGDGTAPHVIEPTVPGAIEEYVNLGTSWNTDKLKVHTNEIIDMYQELIKPHTDEVYEKQITDIVNRYKLCTNKGINYLTIAKAYHDELEKFYIEATDFKVIDKIYKEIYEKIMKYHK